MSQTMTNNTSQTQSLANPTTPDNQSYPMIYVNGQMLPKENAKVSVYDHGLLYGDGIFEGIRVYKGKIFKCQQHMQRLFNCTKQIRLELPINQDEMVRIMRRCIEANELSDGYIRLVITRGIGTLGLHPFKCPEPGIICIADQIALYPPEMYQTGMRVVVAQRPRIPIECLDPRIKSLNYLNNILAKIEAIDAGCLEAIMLNTQGFVSECTGDNIFIVKDGVLYTPPSEAGILEGVTRQFVMDTLCPAENLTVKEKMLHLDDVLNADEVFLTGSAAEIIAVTRIDQKTTHTIITDGEGSITQKLRLRFRAIVTGDNIPED